MLDSLNTYRMTGLAPIETNGQAVAHPLQAGADAGPPSGLRGAVSLANPLVWFGGVLAVTLGLVGVSGSARIGKAKVAASLDKA